MQDTEGHMFDKPTASHTLGLDLDGFSLKGASLKLFRGQVKIDTLFDDFVEAAKEDGNVKQLYIEEEKQQLQALVDQQLVVTAVETKDVLVRPLELTLTKLKDIDKALAFQIEPILPYPIDQAVVDRVILSRSKEASRLSVLILRKDHLLEHLKTWGKLKIDSEIVSAAPQALALFAGFISTSDKPAYILHLGIEHSFCILLDNKKLITAQGLSGGIKDLLKIYSEETHQDIQASYRKLMQHELSLSSEPFSSPRIKEAIEVLRLSVTRTVYALSKTYKSKDVDEMMVTGPGALVGGLSELLTASLNKLPQISDLPYDVGAPASDLLAYALPIGQALSGLTNVSDQINFRSEEFAYPEPWKRLKKPMVQYFALALGIAFAIVLFGNAYVGYQNSKIKEQYLELLETMNKPYKDFEREYQGKSFRPQEAALVSEAKNEAIPLSDLSKSEIEGRMNVLEKDLLSTPQTFPLQPNVPLVSDVLAWIISHSTDSGKGSEEERDQGERNSFLIENFSYMMVKRPEPTKKQEKYQVKVELEFSTETPKLAREFHDILIAPNDIVDPKGEIKWSSNKDKYRTSFYLKDKTIYPNL